MEQKFNVGARIGWWSASWPLADLKVGAEVLELKMSFASSEGAMLVGGGLAALAS